MNRQEFLELIDKYLSGKASLEEEQLLLNYFDSFQLSDEWDERALGVKQELESKMLQRLQDAVSRTNESARRRPVPLFPRWSVAAAIALLLLGAGGFYFWRQGNHPQHSPIVQSEAIRFKQDVAPGGNKAILTLGDGSEIMLDSAGNGEISHQGNTRITKHGGQLAYNTGAPAATPAITYNTITIPRGGQYKVQLPDGSVVWLNAASSLRFPVHFQGTERKVELKGEAYFEIAAKTDMPFKVTVGNTEVAVLGTHFNVNAYENEAAIKATLLQGKIRVSSGSAAKVLTPGQQARIPFGDEAGISITESSEAAQAAAWKDGMFVFDNTDLKNIMRQLERWYNVEIDQQHLPDRQFTGMISRNVNLSRVLKMIEITSNLQFRIEGRNISIAP